MISYLNLNTILELLRAVVDITVTWVVLYLILKIVRNNSRTIQIFKGIVVIVLIQAIANIFKLDTIALLAGMFVQWGPLALIILFAPEIRSILEKLGKTNLFSRINTLTVNEREKLVDELVKATAELSQTQTGALISLEQSHSLSDFIKTGTKMNSIVTSELLCSIFVPGTPLHDGAVIIQGDQIACASAYFPPTTFDFPSSYGARHRAAIGISEITDSISIVVSEETGTISIAEGGKLQAMQVDELRSYLLKVICHTENIVEGSKQIEQTNLDEVEFAQGVESDKHKGPRITAHLMKKSVKKYTKHKVNDDEKEAIDEKAENEKKNAIEAIENQEMQTPAKKRGRPKKVKSLNENQETAVNHELDEPAKTNLNSEEKADEVKASFEEAQEVAEEIVFVEKGSDE